MARKFEWATWVPDMLRPAKRRPSTRLGDQGPVWNGIPLLLLKVILRAGRIQPGPGEGVDVEVKVTAGGNPIVEETRGFEVFLLDHVEPSKWRVSRTPSIGAELTTKQFS